MYNYQRREDPSHATWNSILNGIAFEHRRKGLLVFPQYYIFHSKKDPSSGFILSEDNDQSIRTIADGTARGVVPDFSLALPRLTVVPDIYKSLSNVLRDVEIGNFDDSDVTIDYLGIPLMLELERPPPRHPTSIDEWIADTSAIMNKAMSQADSQAHCLFSSSRYVHQQEVIIMAAAGVWWCWRIARRDEDLYQQQELDLVEYLTLYVDDPDNADFAVDEDGQGEEDELLTPEDALRRAVQFMPVIGRDEDDEGQDGGVRAPNYDSYRDDDACFPKQPCNYANLQAQDLLHVQVPDAPFDPYSRWFGVMRIGTKVSKDHFLQIQGLVVGSPRTGALFSMKDPVVSNRAILTIPHHVTPLCSLRCYRILFSLAGLRWTYLSDSIIPAPPYSSNLIPVARQDRVLSESARATRRT